ncbi:helix-turn-helix domain-containing protein [Vibrio sp. WJH972]
MRLKFLALAHFYEGHSRFEIARFLKVSRTSVNKWITQYHQEGIDGLIDKKQLAGLFVFLKNNIHNYRLYL